ncbi:MAG: hypothetical protein AAB740_01200, partial [Patescibacteria group bacterium]
MNPEIHLDKEIGGVEKMEAKETFNEKFKKLVDLVSNEASDVLDKEILQERAEKIRDSLWVVPNGVFEEWLGGFFGGAPFACVLPGVPYYSNDDKIGKIMIPFNEEMEEEKLGKELERILLHEIIHKFDKDIKIIKLRELEYTDDVYEKLRASSVIVEAYVGPLKIICKDYMEVKKQGDIPSKGARRLWLSKIYPPPQRDKPLSQIHEDFFWEAVTDWQVKEIMIAQGQHFDADEKLIGYYDPLVKKLVDYFSAIGKD